MFQNITELIDIDIVKEVAARKENKSTDSSSKVEGQKQLQIGFKFILGYVNCGSNVKQSPSDIGWALLSTIAPETVQHCISPNIVKNLLLNRNITPDVKNRRAFIKLIRWIIETGQTSELTMAVKQHVSEAIHNQPQIDLSQMIELIEMIQANPEAIPTSDSELKVICEQIVVHLAHAPFGREAAEVKTMKVEMAKVSNFLQELRARVSDPYDIVNTCLEMLYKQIISDKDTSNYASVVLVLLDREMIKPGVHRILQQAENSATIKKVFKTLVRWLVSYDYAPDLSIWVSGIIIGLREQHKHELLLELSLDFMESASKLLGMPVYIRKLIPVVLDILKSISYTPQIFHSIIPKAPKILQELGKLETIDSDSYNSLQDFVDTLSALMLHFPDQTNRYKELEDCLQKYPRSSNVRQILNFPQWQYTSQNITGVSNNARVGLVNLGNTCYMNSVLQALVMTKQFSREILLSKIDAPLFCEIQKLLALLLHSDRPELTPRALLAAARPPDFAPGYQQDSSEFLGYLLEKLHEHEKNLIKDQYLKQRSANKLGADQLCSSQQQSQLSKSPATASCDNSVEPQINECLLKPTLIQKTFDGKLFITYECGECGSKSTNSDAIRSFELSFPESSGMEAGYSVQKLLDFYCSSEKLIGDNQYYCDKCKRLCDGERSIRIMKSPRNLILTLKHFRYDQHRHTRSKLMNKVYHDEIIRLREAPEINLPPISVDYSLYAAVVHAGTSMDSGHYYTFAQDEPDCWYKFNDNYVTKCSIDELHALTSPNTPYILFYQKTEFASNDSSMMNAVSLDMDEEMDAATIDMKSTANLALLSQQKPDHNCRLPKLEDLPPHLRDIVDGDNQSYREENRKIIYPRVGVSKLVVPRNYDSDNDDPPPNSCGNNSIDSINRYIY